MIIFYNENINKLIEDQKEDILFFSNNILDSNNKNIIPFINKYPFKEINLLYSAENFLKENKNKKAKFQIKSNNHKNNKILYLYCVRSYKKRRKIYQEIKLEIDPENFEIEIQEVSSIIKLFNFLEKSLLIETKQYFFGFLINYYFHLKKNKILL